jgi:hypothetical protein
MLTRQPEPQPDDPNHSPELQTIAAKRTARIRRDNLDEVARAAKSTATNGKSPRETMHDQAEIAAREALERLLKFHDSMQSTSGRARQLRDFAKSYEGTHAAGDAKLLATNADWE